jgi:hypothetical protein
MNVAKKTRGVALVILLGIPLSGFCQTYQFSMPISGTMTMGATELQGHGWTTDTCTNSFQGFNFCGFYLNLQTLTETIYLDPVNFTIRQAGFISVTPSASQFLIHEYQVTITTNNQPFPQPPIYTYETNTADITVQLSLLQSGFSFDTGVRPLTYDTASGLFTCDGNIITDPATVNGSYSVATSGQTNSGVISYTLSHLSTTQPGAIGDNFVTFNHVSTTNYPTALFLTGAGQGGAPTLLTASPPTIEELSPTTNFFTLVWAGSIKWLGYIGPAEAGTWTVGPVTATNAPTISPPMIVQQPQPLVVHAHDSASFTVTASGALPLSYQWSLNGTNISGATSSTLSVPSVTQSDLGNYAVVVTNDFGTVTSSNAVLSMYPYLATPFTGLVTDWGFTNTLSVAAWGTGPLYYQWYDNGIAVANATNQSLTLSSIQFTNAGLYSVVVNSALGSVTNTPAQVIVNPAGVSLGLYPGITISGVVGYHYVIQRTADLSDTNSWVTIANVTLAQPVQLWVDTNVDASLPINPRHFYKVLPGQ